MKFSKLVNGISMMGGLVFIFSAGSIFVSPGSAKDILVKISASLIGLLLVLMVVFLDEKTSWREKRKHMISKK